MFFVTNHHLRDVSLTVLEMSLISLLNSSNDRFSKSKKKQIEEILDQSNATLQIIAKEVTKKLSPLAKCASIRDCLKRIENQKRAASHSIGPAVSDPPCKKLKKLYHKQRLSNTLSPKPAPSTSSINTQEPLAKKRIILSKPNNVIIPRYPLPGNRYEYTPKEFVTNYDLIERGTKTKVLTEWIKRVTFLFIQDKPHELSKMLKWVKK